MLGTVNGLKKFVSIKESPYHGLNFCQGTVSEMLQDPGKEIYDVIRYFGSRKKIFNVHFRNIRGHRDEFVETYPDEGDVDFVKAIQTYREVGYPYLLMPDHVPVGPRRSRRIAVVRVLLRLHSRIAAVHGTGVVERASGSPHRHSCRRIPGVSTMPARMPGMASRRLAYPFAPQTSMY